jgi:hypothetical protein
MYVRAVTQNREMADNVGIATRRIDVWTFGLGSGVAGLGGVALSQLGNVGPELGQSYIVDSFMVVVLGGVGNVAGTVAGAMGLGIANKFLEPVTGAVLGKIMLLVLLILFIQWRPQGMFAPKGRAAAELSVMLNWLRHLGALHTRKGWLTLALAFGLLCVLVPCLNAFVPEDSALHAARWVSRGLLPTVSMRPVTATSSRPSSTPAPWRWCTSVGWPRT